MSFIKLKTATQESSLFIRASHIEAIVRQDGITKVFTGRATYAVSEHPKKIVQVIEDSEYMDSAIDQFEQFHKVSQVLKSVLNGFESEKLETTPENTPTPENQTASHE
jgi:hypothetical protein